MKKEIRHRVGVVVSQFNKEITDGLLAGALKELEGLGFQQDEVEIMRVPGAFELPLACQSMAETGKFSGLIALGCVLRGETDHYDAVCQGVTYGLQKVMLDDDIPIMFGVLMCREESQAEERSKMGPDNKGAECARSLFHTLTIL